MNMFAKLMYTKICKSRVPMHVKHRLRRKSSDQQKIGGNLFPFRWNAQLIYRQRHGNSDKYFKRGLCCLISNHFLCVPAYVLPRPEVIVIRTSTGLRTRLCYQDEVETGVTSLRN